MIKHLEINLSGNLKGLAMMQFAQVEARRLGIFGYIKRLPTGTLHIEAEGEEASLAEFVEAFKEREEWEDINDVSFSDNTLGYDRFYIRKFG